MGTAPPKPASEVTAVAGEWRGCTGGSGFFDLLEAGS